MENNEPEKKQSAWRGPENLANRNGRPKGAKNKNTAVVRQAFQNLVEMNLDNMSAWLANVAADNPEKAFKLMIDLSEYVLPKLQRTELTGQNGADLFKDMKFEFGNTKEERNEFIDIETSED